MTLSKGKTVCRFHLICNSLKKLLNQPKTLTCYICCFVILSLNISLILLVYTRLHTPFQHLNPYELKTTRITLNEINNTMEEIPSKLLLVVNAIDKGNAKTHQLLRTLIEEVQASNRK